MKNVLAAVAVAGPLVAGFSLPALADTSSTAFGAIDPNQTYTVSSTSATRTSGLLSGSFTDTFTFSLTTLYDTAVSLTTNTVKGMFSTFQYTLTNSSNATVSSGTVSNAKSGSGVGFEQNLASGDYTLVVSGTVAANTGKASYSGTLNVLPVPLPGTVGLFGAAILGLGVAGVARKRRQAAVSA